MIITANFQKKIYSYYHKEGRILPWRATNDPYKIFVSEIMLQQTQVSRVLQKYPPFIHEFPNFIALSQASLSHLLSFWQGLGYNRRCLALQKSAQQIIRLYQGAVPRSLEALIALPGVGHATASALLSFCYNLPSVFLETNIRTVFIHFFFPEHTAVYDRDILPLVEKTLDVKNPREWYYALMDYGVMLKETKGNYTVKSKSYHSQRPFQGSHRQIRGKVLRLLLAEPGLTEDGIAYHTKTDINQIKKVVQELAKEGFLENQNQSYRIR